MATKTFGLSYPSATALASADTTCFRQAGALVDVNAAQVATFVAGVFNTVTALTPIAGVVTIDCSLGDYFTLAPTANVTSILFTNLPGAGKGSTKIIRFTQDTTPRTVAWPASFRWEGAAPVVSVGSGAVDLLSIITLDNGTKWDATLSKGRV